MKRLRTASAAVAAAALLTTAAGCASGNSESGVNTKGAGGGKQITIGYINWDEDVAVSNLWQKILQDKGYNAKIQQVSDAGPTYIGLSKGNIDLFLDGWLPSTHAAYWKKYGKQLTDISTWFKKAPLTIAVPNYVKNVKSIADLKSHAAEFNNTITGIEPGAGETSVVKDKMMPAYGLSGFKLQTSSTGAMLAQLQKSIKAHKPIVVDLWKPHWAYTAFPIHDLADPKGAMGKPDSLHAIGTGSFGSDFPKIQKMLKKFHMNNQQLSTLENDVLRKNKDNPQKGVTEWLKANPSFESSLG